jgi:hypothetical protein
MTVMADEESPSVDDQAPEPDHIPGTGKGEETALKDGKEPGREDLGTSHADRPAGTRTARDATSAAKGTDPIDPESPQIPPP